MMRQRICVFFILLCGVTGWAQKWSFDQRQILLVQSEDNEFPDELTTAQILDAFVKRGRIRFVTHKEGVSPVSPLKVPAAFEWSSSPVVRQLGLKYKADGILILRKKGVRIELEWYSINDGEPLFFESQNLPEASKEQEEIRRLRIQNWVREIWSKIPGDGYVIRRDLDSVYIEGAKELGLKVGDRLDLHRIVRYIKHPMLKTLMKVETSQSGVVVISEMSEPLVRAKIEYESPADPIEGGDRYLVRPDNPVKTFEVAQGSVHNVGGTEIPSDPNAPPTTQNEPRVAEVTAIGRIGSVSHEEKFNANSKLKMTGTAPGLELQLRGFLTREWLADFHYGMNFFSFSDVPADYHAGNSVKSGNSHWRLTGGYRIFFMEDVFPSGELVITMGYSKYSLKMAKLSADKAPQAKSYSGFEFGLKLQVPVVYRFAAQFHVYRMLGAGLSESPKTAGSSSSNSVYEFQIGGKYVLSQIQEVFGGIRFNSLSSEYDGQGTRGTASESTNIRSTSFLGGYTHKF